MRRVLDTNIVASGLFWNGTPAQLIDAARTDEIEIFTSRVLLAELTRILRRAKFAKAIAASGLPLDELVLGYAELAALVVPAPIPATVINDPDIDAPTAPTDQMTSHGLVGRPSKSRLPCSRVTM